MRRNIAHKDMYGKPHWKVINWRLFLGSSYMTDKPRCLSTNKTKIFLFQLMMGTQNSKPPVAKLCLNKFTCRYNLGPETENCSSVKEYCYCLRNGNNWRASCKKGVYRILADFHFFAGSSWFLADWLVLTWKASFRNFFCRLALRSPEITYAKKLSFPLETFCSTKNKRSLLFC